MTCIRRELVGLIKKGATSRQREGERLLVALHDDELKLLGEMQR